MSEFQTFGDPQLELMKTEAARFITAFEEGFKPRWLSLLGSSGAGKTMLTRLICRACFGDFNTWTDIATNLREREHRWFRDLIHSEELVVCDDLGAEYETGFITAKLYEFCSTRVGKWTVITANLSLATIGEKLDARIASRMIRDNSVVVDVDVADYNLREARERSPDVKDSRVVFEPKSKYFQSPVDPRTPEQFEQDRLKARTILADFKNTLRGQGSANSG